MVTLLKVQGHRDSWKKGKVHIFHECYHGISGTMHYRVTVIVQNIISTESLKIMSVIIIVTKGQG